MSKAAYRWGRKSDPAPAEQTNEITDAIHVWRDLRDRGRQVGPIVPLLTKRFNITPVEAVQAIRRADGGAEHG